jgi:predicted Rossmann fold nucleotide-binding protein DprA/Smf involved in DNA uptake
VKVDATPAAKKQSSEPAGVFTERQSKILSVMGNEPMSIDLLIDRSSYSAHEVLQEMTLLTLRGLIKRVDGQTFVRHNLTKT